MKHAILIAGLIIFIGVIGFIVMNYYIITPIKITKVKVLNTEHSNKGDYWVIINNMNEMKGPGINTDDFTFDDGSYIITYGRELKELRYKRFKQFPYTKSRYGIAFLGKEYYSNKMFIYKLPKDIKIHYDYKMMEKDNVQIED